MTTARFSDNFARQDGVLGSDYTIACGAAELLTESVMPVTTEGTQSGDSPIYAGTTAKKTQVLYTGQTLDGADCAVRAVWYHLGSILGFIDIAQLMALATEDPSFTILARMGKDQLLVDLGREEDPACYDQGYGLRVTCPRDGSAPILKIIKYSTKALPPGILGPTTPAEADGAFVLASLVLTDKNLNHDQTWNGIGDVPYRGFMQSMRLRVRRSDDQVILEAYLNDRNIHVAVLSYTDYQHPLWGKVGVPGFEFISATSATQSAGTSPYSLKGIPLMACQLFDVEAIKDTEPARISNPSNLFTYTRCAQRVIQLVERNGDAKYTATLDGQTKLQVYTDFVLETEKEIIRKEGYYDWLYREERIYLIDGEQDYPMPENCGLLHMIRPGSWNNIPLQELTREGLATRIGVVHSSGRPVAYSKVAQGPNNRPVVRLFPTPSVASGTDVYMVVEYYARPIHPMFPTVQIPFVPQEHIDVLIYGATSKALLMDTDDANVQFFEGKYQDLLMQIRRANNRKTASRQTVMRSASDVYRPELTQRLPLLRNAQNLVF